MTKTFYCSFGDLAIGDVFVWYNPFVGGSPSVERMVKVSARRYVMVDKPGKFHASAYAGVRKV